MRSIHLVSRIWSLVNASLKRRVAVGLGAALVVATCASVARPHAAPAVKIAPVAIESAPEPPRPERSPGEAVGRNTSRAYRPSAYWEIQTALHASAAALRAGRFDEANALLSDGKLARATGVPVDHITAGGAGGPRGSLDHPAALTLARSLFDISYAFGQPHHRGIVMGDAALVPGEAKAPEASLFASSSDHVLFATYRVLSKMEPWIRVWQDVAGIRPISSQTRAYMLETHRTNGWSNVDVIAVYFDLGIEVPSELAADTRFPEWSAFVTWQSGNR